MVIKLTNVSKVIKKAKVLDNINLELTSGKVYGFKGKNGSGKTMLMRVICFVQICVSQIMSPLIGYIVVVMILVMGVFFKSFAFIGNGFMAIRNILYTPEGGDMTLTVAVDIVLIIVSCVVGYFSFKRMDILKRSDWRM